MVKCDNLISLGSDWTVGCRGGGIQLNSMLFIFFITIAPNGFHCETVL